MTEPDDLDLSAAEYVLGSLPEEERAALAARRGREPALDAAISSWENRLSPLLEIIEPVEPPVQLIGRIERQVFRDAESFSEPSQSGAAKGGAEVIVLHRRVQRWQRIAAGAFGLAAAIAVVFGLRETGVLKTPQAEPPTSFVAMLQKDSTSPAFVVSVNIATRELTIRPVAAEQASGKSYELWLVNKAFPAPRSLGVVGEENRPTEASLKSYSPEIVKNSILAVTLEPKGGSPTGSATGPVLFTGSLVQLSP